jgi:hypothetical protein
LKKSSRPTRAVREQYSARGDSTDIGVPPIAG